MSRDLSMASSISAPGVSEEEESSDNKLMPALISMKNLILHKMRLNANNLLTFAKATPLVHLTQKEVFPVSDATRSDFNMRKIMCDILEGCGKQFKIKYDILSNRFLNDIAKEGSRLLHITSDIYEPDKLWVEGSYGIGNEIPMKKLDQQLRN